MSRWARVCTAWLCCLPAFALGQQQVFQAPSGPAAAAAAEGSIHLDVVVTDKSGKAVSGLDLKDFTLLDNGRPGKIVSFQAYGGSSRPPYPPVEAVVLLDAVNQDYPSVAYERYEVEQFLRQNGGHLAQPVSIFLLTDNGVEVQPLPSLDGNALAAKLGSAASSLRTIGRAAGAWGALERFEFSAQMMDGIAKAEEKKPGRKLLIWMGPGWPMLNSPYITMSDKDRRRLFANIVEMSTELREARISVYSVSRGLLDPVTYVYEAYLKGVKKSDQALPQELSLKVLAVESGGLALEPSNDLTAGIKQCVEDAGAFYTLTFDPPHADGPNEYHALKVQVDKPGLTARTDTGYYNQPQTQFTP
jgi:VWFA-related protein